MKVNTVEQFKVMQFLKENFELDYFTVELIDRYSIKLIDNPGEYMIFKWNGEKVVWEEV